ncbi:hypothetical protein TanjilG_17062 [Lupinus angustifolius]|uniref:Uncharacterized protein n=1 Tax=Lupinus angustifolius TaxID=3871 RepID=A0A394DBJ5_LUPAN|nr:PREDICTED: auxin-induced protein X15-like [Lupinus angustifolius]OIW20615.1 hypothetical protein TanjilG_17062 [Lupinus angustifolius]
MSSGHIKFSQFQYIVKLCQILRQWRGKAHRSIRRTPPDVPSGHLAVCVDINHTRFVVRASYLNHPVFKKLLVEAEEEYGFSNHGPLTIPCEEVLFQEAIRFISRLIQGSNLTVAPSS